MREIKLSRGMIALVDDEDFEELSQWKWSVSEKSKGRFYAVRRRSKSDPPNPKQIKMHRQITQAPDGLVVDHLNHNTLDNRRDNLRVCTQQENAQNRLYDPFAKGYRWMPERNKWRAFLKRNKKFIHLGCFDLEEQAKQAVENFRKLEIS